MPGKPGVFPSAQIFLYSSSVRTYGRLGGDGPLLLLAHGAGAGELHPWMRLTARGLADRGVAVVTLDFPYMAAGRRLPDKGPVLEAAFQEAWLALGLAKGRPAVFAGGKSMGGRIATQAVARRLLVPEPQGVVCFGFPLHPPGKPTNRRDAHLHLAACQLLFVHGTRDPFGTPEEMRDLAAGLPGSMLHLVNGGDHSLQTTRRRASDDNLDVGHAEALDVAAAWMRTARV